MKIQLIVLRQEKGESKNEFLSKIQEYEDKGYKELNSRSYDLVNKLAEITLVAEDASLQVKHDDIQDISSFLN